MKQPGTARRLLQLEAGISPARRAQVAAANSAALRRHFGELTGAFLLPFMAFWRPAGPPPGSGPVPVQGAPHLPPFSHTDFLEGLSQHAFPPVLLDRFGSQVCILSLFAEDAPLVCWGGVTLSDAVCHTAPDNLSVSAAVAQCCRRPFALHPLSWHMYMLHQKAR